MRKKSLQAYLSFAADFFRYRRLSRLSCFRFHVNWKDRHPCLADKTGVTGFDRHYIYHPAWAARILARTGPDEHVDISSTLHFCSLVSAFIPVKFYDYRPADLHLSDLISQAADLQALPFADGSIRSLSCMHVVEHIGLGRYGDPLDPDADLKAIAELKRVLAVGGDLLFVVPIGRPRVMFNAHRIYSYQQIISCFPELELREFALVPDDSQGDGLIVDAEESLVDEQNYGCGCFWFHKKAGSLGAQT